jgi:hypothetical protein
MREIHVTVGPDGSVTVRYAGFVGDACFREAERLYRLLRASGVEVRIERIAPTPEAHTSPASAAKVREVA